jgi:hypothetical protein
MSNSAAIPAPVTRAPSAGIVGILFLAAIAVFLLLATTLLLLRGAPPEAIDVLTSPPATIGRTT